MTIVAMTANAMQGDRERMMPSCCAMPACGN